MNMPDYREELVRRLVKLAHRDHYNCEWDTFYGCPLSVDGCSDARYPAGICNCGTDAHNAEVEAVAHALGISE